MLAKSENSAVSSVSLNQIKIAESKEIKNPWARAISESALAIIEDGYGIDEKSFSDPYPCFVTAYFSDLETRFVNLIDRYPVIVGCVAWLTNARILSHLKSREMVSLIINKENWGGECIDSSLLTNPRLWRLMQMYSYLPMGATNLVSWSSWHHSTIFEEEISHNVINALNLNDDWISEPIRVISSENSTSLMHNNFIVACDKLKLNRNGEEIDLIIPREVWTGSFDFTENGRRNLENAVVISSMYSDGYYNGYSNNQKEDDWQDKCLNELVPDRGLNPVQSFFMQWQRLFAVSESFPEKLWSSCNAPHKFNLIG